MEEVTPFIRERLPGSGGLLATGCSMGAYHSVNFFLRHPDVFDAVIALSGVYQLGEFLGGYMDENVYFNTPLAYLPNLEDPWYLDRYRRSQIVDLRRAGRLGGSDDRGHPGHGVGLPG